MGQFFTDDIDALVKEGHGDHERLMRIKSDFEAKKLVTLEDRRYVEGLVSRYLQPSKPESERIVKIPEKRIVPPPSPPSQNRSVEMKYQKQMSQEPIPKIGGKRNIRNVVVSVAVVVAALLIISVVAINRDNLGVDQPAVTENIELDQTSYARGDIISISGKAPTSTTVQLVISNPSNQQIWSEAVSTKANGEFSTLTIAGGDGWEQSGSYTLSSTHGGTTEQVTFEFTN